MPKKKKDVTSLEASTSERYKSANLPPKKWPATLPGYVESQMVRCGKSGCRCKRGQLHGPYFYLYSWSYGRSTKEYVRLSDVAAAVSACQNYRDLQAQLRRGRAIYKALLARARGLI